MTRVPSVGHIAGWVLACLVLVSAGLGATAAAADAAPGLTLTVTASGTGSGVVTSSPTGIDCGSGADAAAHAVCSFRFDAAVTSVALSATPDAGMGFGGFGGVCSGTSCTVSLTANASVTATFDKPPIVTITAPSDGHAYTSGAVPAADFACTPDPGSTLGSCTGKLDSGSAVAPGAALPASAGRHTLTVIASDADGLSTTVTSTYTVNPPPTCSDLAVATNQGAAVNVRLACSDPNATVTYLLDSSPGHGTTAKSGRVVTYTPAAGFAGTDGFTYHGVSADGASTSHTVTILVLAPPTAQISAPAAGQAYTVGQSVPTRFACADDPAGPGIRSCVDSGGATDGSGTLNTSSEGRHSYIVTATSKDGQIGTATVDYTIVGRAPQVVITAPVDNAAYVWTSVPAADFACLAGAGSTVQSCKASVGGQAISDHQGLPNTFGVHTLTVTATDADGLSTTASATYTITSSVNLAPPVSIEAPTQGAAYRLGQVVGARYSCRAPASGPALKSCVGTVRAGHRINTRTLGTHIFSVSATNDHGASTTETVSYTVIPTSNRFVVTAVRAGRAGVARLRLTLPGPGSVKVAATAWNAARGASRRRVIYGVTRVGARRAGPVLIAVAPSASGRALLRLPGARPVISLQVIYTPTGAKPRAVRLGPLRLR